MKLSLILQHSGITGPGRDPDITSVVNDSRRAGPGALFFALPGARTDGRLFARQALEKGAAAVISGVPLPADIRAEFPGVVFLETAGLNKALSRTAANLYGHPSGRLKIYGITGTKGKTTTAYLLESMLARAGSSPGVIGTIDYRVGAKVLASAVNTTPLAHDLQSLLAEICAAGAEAAVMEVSSHALALGRVEDVEFDCAAFTNLQSDHLDFHKDRETYFRAKAGLFTLLERSPKKNKCAVINADDERAPALTRELDKELRLLTFGINSRADLRAGGIEILANMTRFELTYKKETVRITLKLLGRHNVYNTLAAAALAVAGGMPLGEAALGAEDLENVPGRLQRVDLGQNFSVFVDYAHTGAALENVLSSLKSMPHGRIITVFGCGGDRDRSKRAPMGSVSCSLSDLAIVTTDNPRTEAPERIFADIEAGIAGRFSNYEVVPDRRAAITRAIGLAAKGDIVLIAGKGHETYQILKDRTIRFSDAETATEAIKLKLED